MAISKSDKKRILRKMLAKQEATGWYYDAHELGYRLGYDEAIRHLKEVLEEETKSD